MRRSHAAWRAVGALGRRSASVCQVAGAGLVALFDEFGGGDHTIVVGRVVDLGAEGARLPLLFHRGRYGIAPTAPERTAPERTAPERTATARTATEEAG